MTGSKRDLERAVEDLEAAEGETIDTPAEAYAALVAAACGDPTHSSAELSRALERWPALREGPSR